MSINLNIFELTNQQLEIKKWMEKFYDDPDIDSETLDKFLEVKNLTEQEYIKKVESYYYLIRHWQGLIEMAKNEENRINRIKKIYERSVERMKKTLQESMELQKRERIEFATGKMYLKNNPDRLDITMEDQVPKDFIIIDEKINKKLINETYKKETELPEWLIRKAVPKSIILK